jgi:uncharacterized protein (TIGR00661 family)
MKILYAVQGTGNGHISRLIELWPALKMYGDVDVVISGSNSQLTLPCEPRSRFSGFSLFYRGSGGLDHRKMFHQIRPIRFVADASRLPVEQYDLVLVDFEPVTALACHLKGVPFVHIGHQASFQSQLVPRPERRNSLGELILKYFAYSRKNIGFHFQSWEPWILPPVIPSSIWNAEIENRGHTTVYLPQYKPSELKRYLVSLQLQEFQVFHQSVQATHTDGNITWFKPNKEAFHRSLCHANGVLTAGGFETPAEALFLNKKLMVIPIKGQYEQACNAAALKAMGVTVLPEINLYFGQHLQQWMKDSTPVQRPDFLPTHTIVEKVFGQLDSSNTGLLFA